MNAPPILDNRVTANDLPPSARSAVCGRCGAPNEPLDKFCARCGQIQPEPPVQAELAPMAQQRFFRCNNCGAEVAVEPDQRSYTCAFCDSNYVVEFQPVQTGRQAPEFVIGFSITPEEANERFRRWLANNSWFRPGDLTLAQLAEKLRGAYLPFWSFSMLAQSRWKADIGEHWYRTESYTTTENDKTVTKTRTVQETEWWTLAGGHHDYHSGFLVSGSRGLPQEEAEGIKPFHLPALKRYAPGYLAGWLCEEYSITREEAMKVCQEEFFRREQEAIAAHLPGDTHRNIDVETDFRDVGSDLILLPIYLAAYRYHDKVYRFLINGQTGKVHGDKPVSAWRITTAVVAVLVGIGLLALLLALGGAL